MNKQGYRVENKNEINCCGLGAHSSWNRNTAAAERNGQTISCAHCAKGMEAGNGWLVRWSERTDRLYPFDAEIEEETIICVIGNACIKQFCDKDELEMFARKVEAVA
jgi:hypothetical protein